jgi:hypothetical protein
MKVMLRSIALELSECQRFIDVFEAEVPAAKADHGTRSPVGPRTR